jgi:hypothetical protein
LIPPPSAEALAISISETSATSGARCRGVHIIRFLPLFLICPATRSMSVQFDNPALNALHRASAENRSRKFTLRVASRSVNRELPTNLQKQIGSAAPLGRRLRAAAHTRLYPPDERICWPMSARVGNVKNNDPSLIEPVPHRDHSGAMRSAIRSMERSTIHPMSCSGDDRVPPTFVVPVWKPRLPPPGFLFWRAGSRCPLCPAYASATARRAPMVRAAS